MNAKVLHLIPTTQSLIDQQGSHDTDCLRANLLPIMGLERRAAASGFSPALTTRRVLAATGVATLLALIAAATYIEFLAGVTRPALSHSVATTAGNYVGNCMRAGASRWRCALISYDGSDGGIAYDVTADGRCWSGRLVRTGGMLDLPKRPTGCIDLTDRLFDTGSEFVEKGYY